MFKSFKSNFYSSKKLLNFAQKVLLRNDDSDCLSPNSLGSGDIDGCLGFADLLALIFDEFDRNLPNLEGLLGHSEVMTDAGEAQANISGQLLWLLSHYISSDAASHGLSLASIENRRVGARANFYQALCSQMPTSVRFDAIGFEDGSVTQECWMGGGIQSDFEKNDLDIFSSSSEMGNKISALVVHAGESGQYLAWVKQMLMDQKAIAYIVLMGGEAFNLEVMKLFPEWDIKTINIESVNVMFRILSNPHWDKTLNGITQWSFLSKINNPTANSGSELCTNLPLVPFEVFGLGKCIAPPKKEILLGAKLLIYSLNVSGKFNIEEGFSRKFSSVCPGFYELEDVCISGTGVLWRDAWSLADGDLSHDRDRISEGSVSVETKVSKTLAGSYFLAPTNNPHHSHLMFETIQNLHFLSEKKGEIGIIASRALTDSQRKYFSAFGFSNDRCIYKDPLETVKVDKLYFCTEAHSTFSRKSTAYLRSIGFERRLDRKSSSDKIYLSRRDSRVYRNLINEIETENIFRGAGFEIVKTSELSPEEKIQLFANARYIAGPLGAAFTYAPFASNAELIVLTSNMYFPKMFLELASIQSVRIHYIRGIGLRHYNDVWGYEHCSFYTPPNLLNYALTHILTANEKNYY